MGSTARVVLQEDDSLTIIDTMVPPCGIYKPILQQQYQSCLSGSQLLCTFIISHNSEFSRRNDNVNE